MTGAKQPLMMPLGQHLVLQDGACNTECFFFPRVVFPSLRGMGTSRPLRLFLNAQVFLNVQLRARFSEELPASLQMFSTHDPAPCL